MAVSPAPELLQPNWDDLADLVGGASDRLLLMMPFYSEGGVERVLDNLASTVHVTVATRLSPADWAANVADPEALHAFLDLLEGREELYVIRRLHAKAYFANDDDALIGSANLTSGGFGGNIELAIRLRGGSAADALRTAIGIARAGTAVSVEELHRWIVTSIPAIEAARRVQSDAANELESAQRDLDRMLGFGISSSVLPTPGRHELDRFIDWLRTHTALSGADMLLRRHLNVDGQNLQGHVKQAFFAAVRFFSDHPELRAHVAAALDRLGPNDLYQLDAPTADAWNDHVDSHALDAGDGWSYAILRSLMPPGLGGTRLNGGGGSSTLKRILPLVAKYMKDIE